MSNIEKDFDMEYNVIPYLLSYEEYLDCENIANEISEFWEGVFPDFYNHMDEEDFIRASYTFEHYSFLLLVDDEIKNVLTKLSDKYDLETIIYYVIFAAYKEKRTHIELVDILNAVFNEPHEDYDTAADFAIACVEKLISE